MSPISLVAHDTMTTTAATQKRRNAALRADIKKGLRKPQSLVVIPAGFKPTTF